MNKKTLIPIILILSCIPTILSESSQISIEHAGFGETQNEVFIVVHNIGDTSINEIKIFLDETLYEHMENILLEPKQGFETILFLEPGIHTIRAETQEGAYDSIELSVSAEEKETAVSKTFIERNKVVISIVIIVITLGLVWILTRKPKT